MALEASLEIEQQICAKLAPTPCVVGKTILPPTRQYSSEEASEYLRRSGADAVLFATLVADQSDTRYFGTITTSTAEASGSASGTVDFYGNTAYWNGSSYGSATGQSVSTPIYGLSRDAFGQLGLFNASKGAIVWKGEIHIRGHGLLNITDSAFIGSASSKIAAELKSAGLVN